MPKIRIRDLRGGLNKKDPPHLIGNNQCSELQNVVYRNGIWTKRPGIVHRVATGNSDAMLEYVDYVSPSGVLTEVAGSNTNLYYWNGATWTSRFSTGATRATTDKWWFVEFFNKSYACNGKDGIIRTTDPASINYTTFAWGDTTINNAKVMVTMNQRLFFMNTDDSVNGVNINRIIYSNVVTDPTGGETTIPASNWIPLDFTQSPIQAAAVLPNRSIAIWTEDKVASLVDTGANPAFVIKFSANNGIIASKAFTVHPRGYFYISHDGFYLYNGGQPVPVGNDVVVNYFFSNVSANRENTYCWTDLENSEIHILYSTGPEEPDRHLVWNYLYDMWCEFTNISAYSGAYLFRRKQTPASVYTKSAGITGDRTGSLDNGGAIPTKLTTKAFYGNVDVFNEFREIPFDYVQTDIVQTDAQPNTTTVATQGADYGTETFTQQSSNTIDDTDGISPRADVWGEKHYQRWELTGFNTVSELIINYTGEAIE